MHAYKVLFGELSDELAQVEGFTGGAKELKAVLKGFYPGDLTWALTHDFSRPLLTKTWALAPHVELSSPLLSSHPSLCSLTSRRLSSSYGGQAYVRTA